MKNVLMNINDKILIRKRAVIETVNDELKNIAQIEHSRHRSFNNFIANALSAIAAYCFFDKKPAIEVEFVHDGQLTLFKLYRTHVKIEAKNAELKNVLGYDRATSYGMECMRMQGALTIFVANIKRILKLS